MIPFYSTTLRGEISSSHAYSHQNTNTTLCLSFHERQILHGILLPTLFLLQLILFCLFLLGRHDLSMHEFQFRGSVFTKAFSRGFTAISITLIALHTSWSHLLLYFLHSFSQLTPRSGSNKDTGFEFPPSKFLDLVLPSSQREDFLQSLALYIIFCIKITKLLVSSKYISKLQSL